MSRKIDFSFIEHIDTEEQFQSRVVKRADTLVVLGAPRHSVCVC